ncbi:hypothetical protein ABTK14_22680, partial [Acinetobacter baumannii]
HRTMPRRGQGFCRKSAGNRSLVVRYFYSLPGRQKLFVSAEAKLLFTKNGSYVIINLDVMHIFEPENPLRGESIAEILHQKIVMD